MTAWPWQVDAVCAPYVRGWIRLDDDDVVVARVEEHADGSATWKLRVTVHVRDLDTAFGRCAERLSALGIRTAGPRIPDELLNIVPALLGGC